MYRRTPWPPSSATPCRKVASVGFAEKAMRGRLRMLSGVAYDAGPCKVKSRRAQPADGTAASGSGMACHVRLSAAARRSVLLGGPKQRCYRQGRYANNGGSYSAMTRQHSAIASATSQTAFHSWCRRGSAGLINALLQRTKQLHCVNAMTYWQSPHCAALRRPHKQQNHSGKERNTNWLRIGSYFKPHTA